MYLKVAASLLVVFLAVARAGIPGAPVDASMNDQGARDALQFAVSRHNKATNDVYVSTVSRVINVQRQVVAGLKYIFTVEMARTSCRKGGVEKVCTVHSDPAIARVQECKLVVWSQPWSSMIKLVENTCK